MGNYQIQCTACGQVYPDTGSNECPDRHAALQRTVYAAERLHCADLPGMMRFYNWLPIHHTPAVTAGPVTYKSEVLATPANWQPGDKLVVPALKSKAEMDKRLSEGYECKDWYLCFKKI